VVIIDCDSRLSLHCWLLYEQIVIYVQGTRCKVLGSILLVHYPV